MSGQSVSQITESPQKSTSSLMTKSQINWSDKKNMMETPSELLRKFRDIVKQRGIRGLIGL